MGRRLGHQLDSLIGVILVVTVCLMYYHHDGVFPRRAGKAIVHRQDFMPHEITTEKPMSDPVKKIWNTHLKKLAFKAFDDCNERPAYIDGYEALCYYLCPYDGQWEACQDHDGGRIRKVCLSDYHMIGAHHSSGSKQIISWFKEAGNPDLVLSQQLIWPTGSCPDMEIGRLWASKQTPKVVSKSQHALNIGAVNLLANKQVKDTTGTLEVQTAVQILGYMTTPNSRFYIQLPNPTDRLIDQLYMWHNTSMIYPEIPAKNFTAEFVHEIIVGRIKEWEECKKSYNELVCLYTSTGRDGDMKALIRHSLYILLLEGAFKFIPRSQILISKMPTTDDEKLKTMKALFDFLNQTDYAFSEVKQQNSTIAELQNNVLEKTISLLDDFFKPYNKQLSRLLRSDEWLYLRS